MTGCQEIIYTEHSCMVHTCDGKGVRGFQGAHPNPSPRNVKTRPNAKKTKIETLTQHLPMEPPSIYLRPSTNTTVTTQTGGLHIFGIESHLHERPQPKSSVKTKVRVRTVLYSSYFASKFSNFKFQIPQTAEP